jgi:hypothetical protein
MNLEDPGQINPLEFQKQIEDLVRRHKFDHIQAIKFWSENNEVSIEDTVPLINKPLKAKIQFDAEKINYLPKRARLPV